MDGGYRVTGKWTFASGCANATLLGGHSWVFEKDGTPRKRADGSHLDRTMLFVKSKATIHDMWHTLGLRGTASYTYEVNDLFVPEEETFDRDAPGGDRRARHALSVPRHLCLCGGLQRADARHRPVHGSRPQGARHDQVAARGGILAQGEPRLPVAVRRAAGPAARRRAYLHTTLDEIWDKVEAARAMPIEERANHKLATTYVINQGVDDRHRGLSGRGPDRHLPDQPVRAAPARRLVRLAAASGPAVQLHHHRPRPAWPAARHDPAAVSRPSPSLQPSPHTSRSVHP